MSADVPAANPYQFDEWNGDEGAHWVAYADAYDRMSEPFDGHLFDAASLSEQPWCSMLVVVAVRSRSLRLIARALRWASISRRRCSMSPPTRPRRSD